MAENTAIEWADDSVSFWWGCTYDGPGCLNCYAERLSKRSGHFWGPQAPRLWIKSATDELLRLNRKANREDNERIVFVNSMSDFFEEHRGQIVDREKDRVACCDQCGWIGCLPVIVRQLGPQKKSGDCPYCGAPTRSATLRDLRRSAFTSFDQCDRLRLLLLTKRPENIPTMWCSHVNTDGNPPSKLHRRNVWIGTSVATQADANRNLPLLRACRDLTPVLFLSIEPLLEDLGTLDLEGMDWVIVGGESGAKGRPMHPNWPRSIRDQCVAAGVPFLFKQHGEWIAMNDYRPFTHGEDIDAHEHRMIFSNGVDTNSIPREKRRDYCQDFRELPVSVMRVGKKSAGRLLDGVEWNEMPKTAESAT